MIHAVWAVDAHYFTLLAVFYPFNSLARALVVAALLGLHAFTKLAFNISFRENIRPPLVFTLPILEWFGK